MRNTSPQKMFQEMAGGLVPAFHFDHCHLEFDRWKEELLPRVMLALGDAPKRAEPNEELLGEWEDRGLRKRKYLIDVGEGISAVVQVNFPKRANSVQRSPMLLCWHGHGGSGKDAVMGNLGTEDIQKEIRTFRYDYGHRLAEEGFVTFALDLMGFGDRDDGAKPHFLSTAAGHDWCNLYYLHATMLGMTPLGINLAHGRAATDFVGSLPEVDPERLGVMGLSCGGTMALWTALVDPRVKAAEIACYSDSWPLFGIRDINYCGSQIAPGLLRLADVADLQGLLAPRPLLVGIGANDKCFLVENALKCLERVRRIYRAANAESHLHVDLFAGGHQWGGNQSKAFFGKYL